MPHYYSGGDVAGHWGGVSNVSNRFPGWYGLYNWPYYYGYGYYGPDYGYGYVPAYGYDNGLAYTANYGQYENPSDISVAPAQPTARENTAPSGEEYLTQALAAFQSGDYRNGLLLANHAAVDMPQEPRVHETMSLAMFALKNYRGAAMEAHAALALGSMIDWPTLYAYYGNLDTYSSQLRALEAFVRDNPKAPEGHFLLAYHYLMMGHKAEAKQQLTEVIKLVPADKLAQTLLKQL
jgi:tetratricopeptide (TPR) repeat protein